MEKYGTLASGETLKRVRYVECVSQVTADLVKENLLSEIARTYYIRNAHNSDIGASGTQITMTELSTRASAGK